MTGSGCWALVPVKRFDQAKTRLSGLFSDAQRAALAQALLADVIDCLVAAQTVEIAILTQEPRAASLARRAGLEVLDDTGSHGLNAALEAGLAMLRDRAKTIVIVPADLPLLRPQTVRTVCSALTAGRFACISPAARDGGTNLLAFPADAAIAPAFGYRSFDRHREALEHAGLPYMVVDGRDVGLDLDGPQDVEDIRAERHACRTSTLLEEIAASPASGTFANMTGPDFLQNAESSPFRPLDPS